MAEELPTSGNLPGKEKMKTKYTMEEISSLSTMFDTWHQESHSMKYKTKKARAWLKKHKESLVIIIQAVGTIALIVSKY